ncbi:TRAP transporter substrate-binding protein DctP [Cellvibrio polysaccharolyticus]|uniref:TRAP transporter substrate-binding protein n=1 Tax=Cellvibrio polysaccharolyticus TaxID=2082724 RepID=A0A928YV21_9GAMM|nr:TRAP transporter substrate-binding protein DctP [Cellvibrio polysaccharolyticus]MBE8718572.1 TRAP transporter substrate-binding protein [Cellvibrio polysaccharolyticus]
MKLSAVLRLVAIPALLLAASQAQATLYKIATDIQADGTAGRLLSEFSERVEQRTEGRVTFKIFHGGVLGDQLQYFQHIQRGVVDVGLINSASLESVIPAFEVINMPYLFRSAEEYRQVMDNDLFRDALFEAASKHRFAFLGYLSSDFRSIYSTRPIKNHADLQSLRLRTISSQTYIDMLVRFGAVPTVLSFGELYSALQQGVVDGAEGGVAGIYEARFSDVTKHVLLTEHTRLTDFVVSSLKFQQSLSETDRLIVNEEFARISANSITYAEEKEQLFKQKAIDEAGVQFYEIDKTPLIKAVEPMYEKAMQDPEKAKLLKAIFAIEKRS